MRYLEDVFDMKAARFQILSPTSGGAFGSRFCGPRINCRAVMAALQLNALRCASSLKRQQMFNLGYRPRSLQRWPLVPQRRQLQGILHQAIGPDPRALKTLPSRKSNLSRHAVQRPAVKPGYQLCRWNFYTPLDMARPWRHHGVYAL